MRVLRKSLVRQRLGAYPAAVVRVHGRRLAVSVTDLAAMSSKQVRVGSASHLLVLARGTIGCYRVTPVHPELDRSLIHAHSPAKYSKPEIDVYLYML